MKTGEESNINENNGETGQQAERKTRMLKSMDCIMGDRKNMRYNKYIDNNKNILYNGQNNSSMIGAICIF